MLNPPRHIIKSTILSHVGKQWGDTVRFDATRAALLRMAAVAVGFICNVQPPELSMYAAFFCCRASLLQPTTIAAAVELARANAEGAAGEAKVAKAKANAAVSNAVAADAKAAQTWRRYCRIHDEAPVIVIDRAAEGGEAAAVAAMLEMQAQPGKRKRSVNPNGGGSAARQRMLGASAT